VSQRFVEAAIAQGYEQNPTLMAYSREGAGLYQVTVKMKRQSTAVAFLRPIKDRQLDHSNRSIGDSFTL